MRLIDADALKAVFDEKSSVAVCGVELCKAIISRIGEAPTVDAVPVIRCRECRYYSYEPFKSLRCKHDDGLLHATENAYCSYAERKEE